MVEIINSIFGWLYSIWQLVTTSYLFSIPVMLGIFVSIINLIRSVRGGD